MSENNGIVIKKKHIIIGAIIILLLLIGTLVVGLNWHNWFGGDASDGPSSSQTGGNLELDPGAEDWQGEQPNTKPSTSDGQPGIAIPGYKSITLKAGQKEQKVNLYNPEVNDCYFVMSLILPDGTEIWKSKMVAPGKGLYQIELNQKLEAGSYADSILKYECYKCDDNLTRLNGGEVKLIMEVE